MPSLEKILRFIFGALFVLAPVYFGFIKASLPVFLGLTALYTFAYIGERKSLWFASLRDAPLGRNILNLSLTVVGQVFVVGILGLIGRGASTFLGKDYFFHRSFNGVDAAVLLVLFMGGMLSACRRPPPLHEDPKPQELLITDTVEMIDCEKECFSVGGVELSFSPATSIAVESGKMQVHIKSAPISGDPASPFGRFDTSREMSEVGFRFSEIIFPTRSPEIELTHPSPATYIWEEGFKFGQVFFGRISIRKGWFQMRGFLRHGYEAPGTGTPIRVCRKFTPAEVDPSLYQFTSLKEAGEAGPDNVFRLMTELKEEDSTADVAKFENLRYLNLSFESIQDLNTLNRLKNLEELRLASDVTQEFPSAIFEMDSLKSLWLSLKLKSIAQGISKLQNLEALDLRNNELKTIPDEVVELRKLCRLNLSGNQLTSLPERIGEMVALEKLEIKNNPFTSLPKSLCNIQTVGLEHTLKGLYMDMSYPSKHATSIDPLLFLAETDPELRVRVNGLIAQFGLSEYQEALLSEGRLAIQFRTTQKDDGNSLGKTRFGGVPDLPAGFPHPATDGKYWTFLAQINLAEIAALQGYLPRNGLLSFFCQSTNDSYDVVRVVHFKEEDVLYRFEYPAEAQLSEVDRTFPLPAGFLASAHKKASFPSLYRSQIPLTEKGMRLLELSDTPLQESYDQMVEEEWAKDKTRNGPHGVNSYVFTQHESPEEQAAIAKSGYSPEWMVLLAIDYDKNLEFQFSDAGTLTFCIHKKDLAAGDFSNVFTTIEG
jgi:uncharacterized protein YwqG